jgi:uncharacterized YccA/Bax inhibitor family protein
MRTTNPALNPAAFAQDRAYSGGEAMTVNGTVNKAFVLLFVLLIAAGWVWNKVMQPAPVLAEDAGAQMVQSIMPYMMGGLFGGFILAMVTIFKKQWAAVTAPLYALCEGLFLGALSGIMELQYPGIVIQAVALTFGTLFCLLSVYKSGLIKVTDNFRMGVFAATGAIALIYFMSMLLGFFGINVPYIHESGVLGIGFSIFVVVIASLNLVLDFDFIERGAAQGAAKYMEWFAAFGLMVTLVWLYIEILRLLAKLRNRR